MPLQRHNAGPVERPAGLVPPAVDLGGVTELRLHGVGGTTPQNLLADDAPQMVSGNRIAGFFRTADRAGNHVEAYSWGGLTSRSATRVLWLLLFPFALANLAGWMCSPKVWASKSTWRFCLHRTVVRWAALGMTVNLLLLVAMTTMDIGAYQCGARPGCVDHWWLSWLRFGSLADHPARRLVVGAAIPLLLVIGLTVLAGRSLNRYEQVDPPRKVDDPDRLEVPATTPARPRVGLADKDFWNGKRSVGDLALVHIGVALAFLGWLVQYTARAIPVESGEAVAGSWLGSVAALLAVIALAVAATLLTRAAIARWVAWAVVMLGVLAPACAVVFALVQPAVTVNVSVPLPGMRMAANWTYPFCILAAVAVLPVHALGGRRQGGFFAGPFVATAIGVILLNGVGIGTMIRIADLLGNVPDPSPGAAIPSNPLYVYDAVYAVTPYLTAVPTVILLLFALVEAATLWHAARPSRCEEILDDYSKLPSPNPCTVWDRSVLADEGKRQEDLAKAGTLARLWHRLLRPGWAARTARARRLGAMPHDADKLLGLMAFIALGIVGWFWTRFLTTGDAPRTWPWLLTVSTWIAAAFPLGVLLLMRQGWRGLDSRRHIGIVWDVGTFWPRSYHPLAPPSYAERAVPELQRRLWYLHDRQGAAVIAAHSQGSVIAVAALMQGRCRPDGDDVGLITFGCPLTTLYGWAFPAYFGQQALAEPGPRVWSWRNFFYDTDFIGGPVLAASSCLDTRLADPPTFWHIYGQDPPGPGRHSGYWSDPQVWALVDEYAQTIPVPTAVPPPSEQMATEGALSD